MILSTFAITLGFVAATAASQASKPQTSEYKTQPLHVRNSFDFTVNAPQNVVAPLFGAHRERAWAEGWDPQFIYPQSAPIEDKPGEVFTIQHGAHTSTWVNTALDFENGHIQYTYVIPDAMAVLIDIRLAASGASATHVAVTYERTALSPALNDHVRQQGESDAKSGPHWQKAIEDYLKNRAATK
ncbi:MAG: hypothetical protein LAO20_02250 [Acidobacteriia bacterium]|nr:hypothetical protein [Terriglobia bacterium]